MASSNFFLPLTGKEDTQRLETKYRTFLESDEEEDGSLGKSGKGKVSQWIIDDKATTSQWLHSPAKKDSDSVNKVNLRKTHPTQNSRTRRNLQSPKQSMITTAGTKDVSPKTSVHSSNSRHVSVGEETKHSGKRGSTHNQNNYSIDDSDTDDDEWKSDGNSRNKSKKKNEVDEEEPKQSTSSSFCMLGSEGFSTEDTEKPKLSVRPSAAKIDFQLSPDGEEPIVKVPACMNQYLRDYQRDGIRFLYQHYMAGKGAILGDDMGLGKTVQVIGFLSALLGKQGNHNDTIRALPKFIRQLSDEITDSPPRAATKPFLIVGPACVLMNWLEEFNTWGYFTTGKFHGGDKELCLTDVKKGKLEIVVTTFETFRDNVERLCEIEWEAIIVDEVHKMKEPKAQISKALNQITTPCRFGLTGTALQNHMVDLWSIMDWAQPGILGSLEKFNHRFTFAIEMGQRHDANKRDLALARKQRDKFAEIRKRIFIRRTKALIADQLPSKEDNVVMCRLTDFQVSVYKAILNHPHTSLILQAEDPCDCGKKKLKASCCYKYAPGKIKVWSLVLSFMHLLLKAANHCALMMPDGSGKTSKWQAKLAQEVCEEALKDFPQFVQQTKDAAFLTLSDPKYCGKMKILQGLLSVFSSSHDKVLVFSYSTRLLDIIEQYVIGQCFEYRRIDGKTSSLKRMEIVHQFNKDPDIFVCLISTKAGGLGLNLTGANRVVIFDPNWNPSHDLQAQDRAYRIGQTRNVKVYRLVSAGTIEENIYLRQIYKQQLDEVAVSTSNAKRYFHGIQGDRLSRGELFGVKNMFSLRTSDICLTMDILKRNERLEKDLSGYDITRYIPPSLEAESVDDDGDEGVDDNDDDGDESRHEKDGEEDDVLLQALFGKDRIFQENTSTRQSPSTSDSTSATTPALHQSERHSNGSKDDDDDDEDDDFFLPKIHRRSNRERQKETCEAESSENDLFTVDEITFPRSTSFTIKTQHKTESPKKTTKDRHTNWKPSAGLSWLFSDDDDDDNKDNDANNGKEDIFNDEQGGREKGEWNKGDDDCMETVKGQRTTASMLSRLFPDSDADSNESIASESDSGEPVKEVRKEQSKSRARSKRKVNVSGNLNECQPSTSGLRQTKTRATATGNKQRKTGSSKTGFDSVKAVFEECGVLHIHGNKEVIGSSRAEDHMTRCAMQDVFEMKTNTQMPAMQCDPLPQELEDEPKSKKRKGRKDPPDHNAPSSTKVGSVKLLLGQTPPGVQRQTWGDLCKFLGEDQLSVAQRIISCTPEQRLEVLRNFYTHKHPKLGGDTMTKLLGIKSADDPSTANKGGQSTEEGKSSNTTREGKESSSSKPSRVKNTNTTNQKTPKPTSSKSKRNVRRPIPATLTGHTFLDSESQESLTAHSPPMEPSLSPDEDDGERFSPAPPKRKPKHLSPTMSKSAVAARILRQRALNKASKTKLFKKSSDGKGVRYNDNGSGDDVNNDELVSVSCADNDETIDRLGLYVTQPTQVQDIPSLLCEMGGKKPSVRLQRGNSKNSKTVSRVNSEINPSTSKDSSNSETAAYNYNISSNVVRSFPAKDPNKRPASKKQPNTRRDYTSILDDIFGDETAAVNGTEEVNRIDRSVSKTIELSNEQPSSHQRKSDRSDVNRVEDRPSTSKSKSNTRLANNDNDPKNSSVCVVEESVEIIEESDSDYSEVDGLFLTSTLKDDSAGSSRRRKGLVSPGKGKRRKKGVSPRRRYEMEVMEEADGNSNSLFS